VSVRKSPLAICRDASLVRFEGPTDACSNCRYIKTIGVHVPPRNNFCLMPEAAQPQDAHDPVPARTRISQVMKSGGVARAAAIWL
jgi:hypothetical protein